MIAIQTRYLGPTNHKGSRYAAWRLGCPKTRVVLSADYSADLDTNHRNAAMECLRGWLKQRAAFGFPSDETWVLAGGVDSDDKRGSVFFAVADVSPATQRDLCAVKVAL